MRVRAKLLLAVLPLVLAIAGIGALSILTAAQLGENPDAMLRQNYQSVLAAQTMREALARTPVRLVDHAQLGVIGAASWYFARDADERARTTTQRPDPQRSTDA